MAETIEQRDEKAYVQDRQDQFAAVLGVEPEQLRHLQLCASCGGFDYIWTDWNLSPLPDGFTAKTNAAIAYRNYLADSACVDCDATGFAGGSFGLSTDEWLELRPEASTV